MCAREHTTAKLRLHLLPFTGQLFMAQAVHVIPLVHAVLLSRSPLSKRRRHRSLFVALMVKIFKQCVSLVTLKRTETESSISTNTLCLIAKSLSEPAE